METYLLLLTASGLGIAILQGLRARTVQRPGPSKAAALPEARAALATAVALGIAAGFGLVLLFTQIEADCAAGMMAACEGR